nr:unnamed protein product [Callosobruchus analis]
MCYPPYSPDLVHATYFYTYHQAKRPQTPQCQTNLDIIKALKAILKNLSKDGILLPMNDGSADGIRSSVLLHHFYKSRQSNIYNLVTSIVLLARSGSIGKNQWYGVNTRRKAAAIKSEAKEKHRLRYHAKKELVKDMTEREHRLAKKRWKAANRKRRKQQRATQIIMADTPKSTPPPTPKPYQARGRKQVRRDRSALYRRNKRFQGVKQSSVQKSNRYCVLSGAFKDFYTKTRSLTEKRLFRKVFSEKMMKQSRMEKVIVKERLGITQLRTKKSVRNEPILSCFCNWGFCSCQNPKIYKPIPDDNLEDSDEVYFLTMSDPQKQTPIPKMNNHFQASKRKCIKIAQVPTTSHANEECLNNKESLHPNNISEGVYVLVKLFGGKNKYYTYLGKALSSVEEDGDVKIMFFKSVDDSGRLLKLVSGDISYENENIVKIVIEPTKKVNGKRELYEINSPLDIFEK